jgi:hypothetical protein
LPATRGISDSLMFTTIVVEITRIIREISTQRMALMVFVELPCGPVVSPTVPTAIPCLNLRSLAGYVILSDSCR